MSVTIRSVLDLPERVSKIFIVSELSLLKDFNVTADELAYLQRKFSGEEKDTIVLFNRLDHVFGVIINDGKRTGDDWNEKLRRHGAKISRLLKEEKLTKVAVIDLVNEPSAVLSLTEGIALGSYSFNKYKTSVKEESETEILVVSPDLSGCEIAGLSRVCEAVFLARDLVNEPVGYLNAKRLGEVAIEMGEKHGFTAEVFNKKKIESLKMGGLLAVNQGSIDPPVFIVLEWKPENASISKPYVLVGKGVVFDTGGINLKTPPGSLDTMKCDMAGAASVIGAFVAMASNNLPVHVVGLIPATDNRLGGNAIVPGDILKMHNGKTVEIINTDAEGRLILADALSFSEKYDPELVIDLATLTGSAVMAIGSHGTVGMGTASPDAMASLEKAGYEVCERIVWFPFWEDYDDSIKSEVADIKNLGGREGGAISAGKFLSHFVTSPWIHLDIAGPAFLTSGSDYRATGGTGVGVRLLYRFLKSINPKKVC
jgi:leucyl aminopeptidase